MLQVFFKHENSRTFAIPYIKIYTLCFELSVNWSSIVQDRRKQKLSYIPAHVLALMKRLAAGKTGHIP